MHPGGAASPGTGVPALKGTGTWLPGEVQTISVNADNF